MVVPVMVCLMTKFSFIWHTELLSCCRIHDSKIADPVTWICCYKMNHFIIGIVSTCCLF